MTTEYQPEVGKTATISLPGEITRAEIVKVISPQAIIVKLNTFTTSKDHNYRRGDHVPCRLVRNFARQLSWEAIPERELAAPQPEREAEPEIQTGLARAKPPEEGFVLGEN